MINTTASTQVMMQKVIPLDLFKLAVLNYWRQRNCLIRKGGTGNQLMYAANMRTSGTTASLLQWAYKQRSTNMADMPFR